MSFSVRDFPWNIFPRVPASQFSQLTSYSPISLNSKLIQRCCWHRWVCLGGDKNTAESLLSDLVDDLIGQIYRRIQYRLQKNILGCVSVPRRRCLMRKKRVRKPPNTVPLNFTWIYLYIVCKINIECSRWLMTIQMKPSVQWLCLCYLQGIVSQDILPLFFSLSSIVP
jgi:hypothetical protein